MSFLNFGNNKSSSEHLDTTEIKQAAISDTQLNSLNASSTSLNVSSSVASSPQLEQTQNFVNPFTKSDENEKVSKPSLNPNEQNVRNNSVKTEVQNQNSVPIELESQGTNLNPVETQTSNQTQNLNQLNQNLTQNIQSQESMSKDQIKELIDETVEKVIEEKWDSLTEKVDRVLRWKEKKKKKLIC